MISLIVSILVSTVVFVLPEAGTSSRKQPVTGRVSGFSFKLYFSTKTFKCLEDSFHIPFIMHYDIFFPIVSLI